MVHTQQIACSNCQTWLTYADYKPARYIQLHSYRCSHPPPKYTLPQQHMGWVCSSPRHFLHARKTHTCNTMACKLISCFNGRLWGRNVKSLNVFISYHLDALTHTSNIRHMQNLVYFIFNLWIYFNAPFKLRAQYSPTPLNWTSWAERFMSRYVKYLGKRGNTIG